MRTAANGAQWVLLASEPLLLASALWIGLTYLAPLPLTTGLLTRLYGAASLAVLFGITMALHQAGGFLGAWLGGVEFQATGDCRWMWFADILLAAVAALLHLAVRENGTPAPRPAGGLPALAGAR